MVDGVPCAIRVILIANTNAMRKPIERIVARDRPQVTGHRLEGRKSVTKEKREGNSREIGKVHSA